VRRSFVATKLALIQALPASFAPVKTALREAEMEDLRTVMNALDEWQRSGGVRPRPSPPRTVRRASCH
jgi:hypothetical protein